MTKVSQNQSNKADGDPGLTRRKMLMGSTALAAAQFAGRAGIAGLATSLFSGSKAFAQATKPNIVFILADDLGWKDVGYHGSDIKTPNIDMLAKEGVRVDQFYAQPMCSPTRAALMTGRYPLRTGFQTGVIPGAGTYGLPADEYILPEMLRDAGYQTAMVGKWHLGHAKPEFWPKQRGFDSFYGALVGEIDHFEHSSHGVPDWYRDNKPIVEKGFDNVLFGDEASRVIEAHNESKPLFLYLAFTAPHTPFQAPQEYLDRYKHIANENRRAYAAMVSVMDDAIGKVIASLKKKGMDSNTLVLFQSDNGGTRSKMFSGDTPITGDLPADNGPYRDGKGTLFEGGTRVPFVAWWPGTIKPGVVPGMMHVVDMYPTFARLAGATLGKNKPLDGMDVWPAIGEGKPSPRDEIVYNVDPLAGAVRQGDWKLVWKAALPQKLALFNLAEDASETKNLADQHPDEVKKLQDRITQLSEEMVPPLLIMEAVHLTYMEPAPKIGDPEALFAIGD
jgi:arylsulfatase A-like enzyme